ncbi:MAG: penicillin-binding protein [Bdellovibrio sp.]|nr:penicillin-binding protein [Bdellovibrio sp.]
MRKVRALYLGALVIFAGTGLGVLYGSKTVPRLMLQPARQPELTKENVAEVLKSSASVNSFPNEMTVNIQNKRKRVRVNYSLEPKLQETMEGLFRSYGPDYGAFVAMDAKTGRIMSLVSYSRTGDHGNLALRASFPSASVFKVVTAAAAIGEGKISADSVVSFNGRNHTLYRGQILQSKITHWTRFITLKEAFAHSINTVFGKLGAYSVGQEELQRYAGRFGFNRRISADLPVQEGRALIPGDVWGLAESASGFTRENTMSPLQGALIAASVANQGVMMEPFIVQSVTDLNGSPLYYAQPRVAAVPMDSDTASQIRRLMQETVHRGTSRSSFRGFFKKDFTFLDVGGKTGSLTGFDPHGKYEWFVGYADSGTHRLAVAALTIHAKQWRVRSSYLARKAIERYFSDAGGSRTVATK